MNCPQCQKTFEPVVPWQKFCSASCNNKFRAWSSDKQREWVSGNWYRYLNRLACTGKNRSDLTTELLLEVLEEQGGRCALTGVRLTNVLVKDRKIWTNASVDRIVSGGPYIRSNIQLVCAAVNTFRSSMSIEEFREWCRLVASFKGLYYGKSSRLQERIPELPRQARAKEKAGDAKRGSAGAHGGRTSAQGRRQGGRPQEAPARRRKQRPIKSARNLAK